MRAKKHFGQNFLNSPSIVGAIVDAAQVTPQDTVFEIGPGKGSLTRAILQTGAKVIAVEKDTDLIPDLNEKFATEITGGKLELIEGGVIEILENNPPHTPFKVVANIPYNITGQLLRQLLTLENQPTSVTLVVQKEVAERIVCRDGKESVLSLSVKVFGTPKYIQKIPARYFTPKPDVDSAVIHIKDVSRNNIPSKEWEKLFFELIKTGFAHKRKLLIRNLEAKFDKPILENVFISNNIQLNTRAENVSCSSWIQITNTLCT